MDPMAFSLWFGRYALEKARKISFFGFTNGGKSDTLMGVEIDVSAPHCRGAVLSCAVIVKRL